MYTLAIRALKWGFIFFVILVVGGIGSEILDHWVIPKLTVNSTFKNWGFLKKVNESTTIINNTQQLTVTEDDSIEKIASSAASSVVNIVSIEKNAPNIVSNKLKSSTLAGQSLTASGMILANDGLVATYRTAIIEQNAEYVVLLPNGVTYPATLAGIDPLTNIAFLRINVTGLSSIAFANSDDMHPGKKLILMANSAEEYRNRFSLTLLSNINKSFNVTEKTVASSEQWEGVFEVDDAYTGVYLGGPAIDFGGELVGLVGSAHLDNQTSYFLLPANVVRQSFDRFVQGQLTRPTLGVYYTTITPTYALSHHLTRDRGALIGAPQVSGLVGVAVLAGSAAEKAGLRSGDTIIAINGKEINLDSPLSNTVGNYHIGDTLDMLVIRDGKEIHIPVKL
ncbi:MAG: S1C family serine protease [Candidatus Moraniibacteriota bacterium]